MFSAKKEYTGHIQWTQKIKAKEERMQKQLSHPS